MVISRKRRWRREDIRKLEVGQLWWETPEYVVKHTSKERGVWVDDRRKEVQKGVLTVVMEKPVVDIVKMLHGQQRIGKKVGCGGHMVEQERDACVHV